VSVLTLDFETLPITPDQRWPAPVGFAYKIDGGRSRYVGWGHPTENNSTEAEARTLLRGLVKNNRIVSMFNAPFDVGVSRWTGTKVPWEKVRDVQIEAFLSDPYAQPRDLKSFANVHLGLPPEEQNELHDWIRQHVKVVKDGKSRSIGKSRKNLGEFYYLAPGSLVGRYACGDVDRTYGLSKVFAGGANATWHRAYTSELAVLPVLERMTIDGIPLDADAIAADLPSYERVLERCDAYLCRLLGKEVDCNKPQQVADALEAAGLVQEWIETAKGSRSLSYDLIAQLAAEGKFDKSFAEAWGYRSTLAWMLRTFLRPWAVAGASFHPGWNSVKTDGFGAVTGRLSSTPNVQNIMGDPPVYKVPRGWPALPKLRRYIRAPSGYLLPGVDISQQEVRVFAHFAGDPLRQWYRENPKLDTHAKVSEEIWRITSIDAGRPAAKALNLAGIYGQGIAAVAAKLGIEEELAVTFRNAHRIAVPGVQAWMRKLKRQTSFETIAGRTYLHDPERPYKSGNTQVQGSSADQLKRVMVEVDAPLREIGSRLVLTAHDELLAMSQVGREKTTLRIMTEAIEATGWPHERAWFDVPMLAEGYVGETWE
jgi:DNA polymerase I-like protein with 3'-5' exonuclease and polymerase domains